jgi:uncharacterized protein YjbJ (UPF0337 family)
MDKDRIRGSAEQAKGKVKEVVGQVTGRQQASSKAKEKLISSRVKCRTPLAG